MPTTSRARDAAAGKLAEARGAAGQPARRAAATPRSPRRAPTSPICVATRDRIAKDLARNEELLRTGAASRQTVDQQRADLSSAVARAEAANGEARADAVADRARSTRSPRSAPWWRRRAPGWRRRSGRWTQRHVTAPVAALVSDTYARPGETINAGVPVVSLLPPQNILVRFFVPETELATLHVGDRLTIGCDACAPGLTATVTFIAPQPEYTPPVIYSESNREKLVYLIEAHPPPDQAVQLKPGQPVDVRR